MTAKVIDLSIVRARKAQVALPHHQSLFDSTPTGIEHAADEAYALEAAEYARLANTEI